MRLPKRFPSARAGFTLIELILYIAASIAISLTILQMTLLTMRSQGSNSATIDLQQSLRLALERITVEALQANKIKAAGNGILKLEGGPEKAEFSVVSGRLMLKVGSAGNAALTPATMTIQEFQAWDLSAAGETVRVRLSANDASPDVTDTLALETSITLRAP